MFRSSSMGGHLHLKYLNTLLWPPMSLDKIWIQSNIQPVVAELQSIYAAAGWVDGWLVKSVFNNRPSTILYDGSFLWADGGNIGRAFTAKDAFLRRPLLKGGLLCDTPSKYSFIF
jgi:hypothetical protein